MGEETERNRVLRALNDMLEKGARLQAEIEALRPQKREIFENEEQENHPEVQFLHEIVRRVLDGSMRRRMRDNGAVRWAKKLRSGSDGK